jgi:hypothetical protein
MEEPSSRCPRRLAVALEWLTIASLFIGTVTPKVGIHCGTVISYERWPYDDHPSHYIESIRLSEAGWFNRGYDVKVRWEKFGWTFSTLSLPMSFFGWFPALVALLLVGAKLAPMRLRSLAGRILLSHRTWLLGGIAWLGTQLWLAFHASSLLAETFGDAWALFSLLIFLGLNGAILLFAMDGRRRRWVTSLCWHALRGWAQSYLLYLVVISLLLWLQHTWPSLGLPAAFIGALALWTYTHLRIRRLQRLSMP